MDQQTLFPCLLDLFLTGTKINTHWQTRFLCEKSPEAAPSKIKSISNKLKINPTEAAEVETKSPNQVFNGK